MSLQQRVRAVLGSIYIGAPQAAWFLPPVYENSVRGTFLEVRQTFTTPGSWSLSNL